MLRYSLMNAQEFQNKIYAYFLKHKRILPWRYDRAHNASHTRLAWRAGPDPYKILVSEVMLQQTQVARVLVKYPEFIKRFPTFHTLANASLKDVLSVWQGMGYNRRAKYLKDAAKIIVRDKRYTFMLLDRHPEFISGSIKSNRSRIKSGMTEQQMLNQVQHDKSGKDSKLIGLLQQLPGIGQATACAIVTYAYNIPSIFIETNIRAVFLFYFFKNQTNVSDRELLAFVEKTLDRKNPRDWYYALTDYGVMLKTREKFKNIQSRHYTKQSKFEGSRRQLRGRIIHLLTTKPYTIIHLAQKLNQNQATARSILGELITEGLVVKKHQFYQLP